MTIDRIHDYTDAYTESYLRALDKTHNPDLAIQTAMGVTMVLRMIDAQNEPKQPTQPQINLEIWADGSIQGYLSAKQTLKIIERIKARESPR